MGASEKEGREKKKARNNDVISWRTKGGRRQKKGTHKEMYSREKRISTRPALIEKERGELDMNTEKVSFSSLRTHFPYLLPPPSDFFIGLAINKFVDRQQSDLAKAEAIFPLSRFHIIRMLERASERERETSDEESLQARRAFLSFLPSFPPYIFVSPR